MRFHTYILRCSDGSYYVGHTDDIARRLSEHARGTASDYTARRQPVRLLWSTDFATRHDAYLAERRLKGWSRAKKEAVIRGDWNALPALAARGRGAEKVVA